MQELSQTQSVLLALLGKALFEKQVNLAFTEWKQLYREANAHKVFPLVFDVSKAFLEDEDLLAKAKKFARHNLATTVSLNVAHARLHDLLSKENIPYITFKGFASSCYYPNPELRVSGDVDFYVPARELEHTHRLLCENAYVFKKDNGHHRAYEKGGITLELHHKLVGIPESDVGKLIEKEVMEDFIETAREVRTEQGIVQIPDVFHHGMVLLLHTHSHMTSQGIGLRHLCDWAVFEASLTDEEFKKVFEEKLRKYGLLRFAQLLSLCANKFLGAPYRQWQGEAPEKLLEELMADIMAAGNFGKKDKNRQSQVKYIADPVAKTVAKQPVFKQALQTIKKTAKERKQSVPRVVFEFGKKVLLGKSHLDSKKTLDEAAQRKALYSEFHLFEKE